MTFDKKTWQREYMSRWYEQRKERARQYLGNVCVSCGTAENLEFDHVDPSTKSFDITDSISRKWSLILQELDKCQLLCLSCHKEKTQRGRLLAA